jgi:hypothetical protein
MPAAPPPDMPAAPPPPGLPAVPPPTGIEPAPLPPLAPQTALQVMPAGQSAEALPLHSTWHGIVPPQIMLQAAVPSHFAVQPPFGQSIAHWLVPVQVRVEPGSSWMLHALPPAQLTLLFTPVASMQLLVPAQLGSSQPSSIPSLDTAA